MRKCGKESANNCTKSLAMKGRGVGESSEESIIMTKDFFTNYSEGIGREISSGSRSRYP